MLTKIIWFITIFGLIVSGLLYTNTIGSLGNAIVSINSYFLPMLPGELKLFFAIALLGAIYKIYLNFRH